MITRADYILPKLKNDNFMFKLVSCQEAEYLKLQQAVAEKYKEVYAASVTPTPDMFALLKEKYRKYNICGACFGITNAANKQLFSEQYLSAPVENIIETIMNSKCKRSQIIEIGSLISCRSPGSGKKLVEMMPWLIWSLGFKYALITATTELRKIFKIVRMPFYPITVAKQECLIGNNRSWGTYYETQPITGIIDINLAVYNTMHRYFTKKFNITSPNIFEINRVSKIPLINQQYFSTSPQGALA